MWPDQEIREKMKITGVMPLTSLGEACPVIINTLKLAILKIVGVFTPRGHKERHPRSTVHLLGSKLKHFEANHPYNEEVKFIRHILVSTNHSNKSHIELPSNTQKEFSFVLEEKLGGK